MQVAAKVADAVERGAKLTTGGSRPRFDSGSRLAGGSFFEPTVITGGWPGWLAG